MLSATAANFIVGNWLVSAVMSIHEKQKGYIVTRTISRLAAKFPAHSNAEAT